MHVGGKVFMVPEAVPDNEIRTWLSAGCKGKTPRPDHS